MTLEPPGNRGSIHRLSQREQDRRHASKREKSQKHLPQKRLQDLEDRELLIPVAQRQCGNCFQFGHTVKDCNGPLRGGFLDACPKDRCNTNRHNLINCPYILTKRDAYKFVCQKRNNKAPVVSPVDPWETTDMKKFIEKRNAPLSCHTEESRYGSEASGFIAEPAWAPLTSLSQNMDLLSTMSNDQLVALLGTQFSRPIGYNRWSDEEMQENWGTCSGNQPQTEALTSESNGNIGRDERHNRAGHLDDDNHLDDGSDYDDLNTVDLSAIRRDVRAKEIEAAETEYWVGRARNLGIDINRLSKRSRDDEEEGTRDKKRPRLPSDRHSGSANVSTRGNMHTSRPGPGRLIARLDRASESRTSSERTFPMQRKRQEREVTGFTDRRNPFETACYADDDPRKNDPNYGDPALSREYDAFYGDRLPRGAPSKEGSNRFWNNRQ
ncbi:hypothetical protein HYFRA_00008411 [Hymenoscyphus fraxineus]|uniref:CCHC-type domain-containing protein n=1 Tax=Hymenoscyphus fraxineus TaxID=746836 RepID=A0A9N9KLZ6_9HELO|nr:hypothetical protein HYFRA_00008411 [Hymenoscyphus fraxineus]